MERLKGKKQIEELFVSGETVGAFPLRLVFLKTEDTNKVGVSVSKKNFKSAVNRNKIKLFNLYSSAFTTSVPVTSKPIFCM